MSLPPASPSAPREPRRLTVVLLLALAALPYLIGLGDPPLWDANEPLYAEPPREVLESGDWLAPTWNGKPWFVRPPLATWLTVPSYALFGATPFAARLPMALAAIATILATYAIGRALGGRRTGLLGALVLSATARYWLFSRQLAGDVYLVACLVGGFALALPALRGLPEGRRRILLAHALVGIGVLAKGPVILLLYGVPLVLAARLGRPRVPFAALRPLVGTAIVAAVCAPWFAYMTWRYGTEYLAIYFGHHHVRRAVSEEVGGRPVWFYVVALIGDAQPWITLAPVALHRWWKSESRDPVSMLAWLGAAFPLVFFSIPFGKRNVYLLPVYPMLAVALAPFLLECHDGLRRSLARWVGALFALVAAIACVLLVVAARNVPDDIAAGSRAYLAVCGVATVWAAWATWRGSGRAVVVGLLGAMLVAEVASGLLLPILGRYMPVPRLAATLVRESRAGDAAVIYRSPIHSLMFYARRPTVVARNETELLAAIPPGGRAFVLGHQDAVEGLASLLPALRFTTVDRAAYFKFQFSWNVLGKGKSTRDLVLLLAERPVVPGEAPDPKGR